MKDRWVRAFVLLVVAASVLAGCSGGSGGHFGGSQADTVPVTTSMTDTPPAGVSVFSFQVTLTDARLNPGNVELLSAPVTINVARLQTDTSLLSSVTVPPGTYTSVALTFSSPSPLTIENNSGGALTDGVTNCPNGDVCTLSPAVTSLNGNATLPGAGATLSGTTPAALLLDLNLANALVNTPPLQASLIANTTVSQLAPAQGVPFETLEDVVGVVSGPANGAFVLQTALGNYNVTTNSSTQYVNFGGVCSPVGFSCVQASEIASVNMSLQANNTLVATDIFFEDSSASPPEIEGVVVATGGLPLQFSIVVLQETGAALPVIGNDVEVAINNGTTFAIDNLVGNVNYTAGLSFASTADMIVGQEVAVQQGSGSTAALIQAGRVLLRSSRITGTVAVASTSPNFTMNGLPSFLQNASPAIAQIVFETATTFTPNATEYGGTATNVAQIAAGDDISVRGQLFANSGNPKLLASRVVRNN